MTFLGFCGILIAVLPGIIPQGSDSAELVVTPAGPTQNSALVGDTVTLAVSFSGAINPAITWSKGTNPIVTWTINSTTPPDIPPGIKNVVRVNSNGSLIFENVTLNYTGDYTVEVTKAGQGIASVNFILTVYEIFKNVTLGTQPDFAVEGADRFTLQYAMVRGVVGEQKWFFNGLEIKSTSLYSVENNSLVIHRPKRNNTGLYTLSLRNPYSSATVHKNITVLYGPDEPVLVVTPGKEFYVSGSSLQLSCKADGFPPPAANWIFDGQTVNNTAGGVLNLKNVKTSQGGVYTCTVVNKETSESRQKNVTVKVYEKPNGSAVCSVKSLANVHLQYVCSWPGGTPPAQLSFPGLNNSSSGAGLFSLSVTASESLSGSPVSCTAHHPVQQSTCNITARAPVPFLPSLRFGVNAEGKIRVTISCLSAAVPKAEVTWSKGGEAIISSPLYTISLNTTYLSIKDYNVSVFLLHNYTCSCHNPLGVQQREIQLLGPTISDSSLFPNQDGTVITLTWEVPPTSIVTGFDIQMLGPDLLRSYRNVTQVTDRSSTFQTIQQKPGSARSADVFTLNPEMTYRFRIVPKARLTEGEPSAVHRIGPGEGLSGSAIAGIAAGIPAGIIVLLVLIGLICLFIYGRNDESEPPRYPDKTKAELASNNILMTGGLKFLQDYNHLHQVPSERSMALPMFVPPPPVRVATTV